MVLNVEKSVGKHIEEVLDLAMSLFKIDNQKEWNEAFISIQEFKKSNIKITANKKLESLMNIK